MATEQVLFKADPKFLKEVDEAVKAGNYQSRTEFIRESLRKNIGEVRLREECVKKLAAMSREQLIAEFMKFKGKAKVRTTDEQNERTRELFSREFEEKLSKRFNLTPKA